MDIIGVIIGVLGGVGVIGFSIWKERQNAKTAIVVKNQTPAPISPVVTATTSAPAAAQTGVPAAPMQFTSLLRQPTSATAVATTAQEPALSFSCLAEECAIPKGIKQTNGKFLTLVIRARTVVWEYLAEPQGAVWQTDSTVPVHKGEACFVMYEDKKKGLLPYEPNSIPIVLEDTPIFLWDALHCPWIQSLYGLKMGFLEALSKILPFVALGIAAMAAFSVIGK